VGKLTSFPQSVKLKPGEVVVFSVSDIAENTTSAASSQ
jgi:uncharacterized protein YbaA (DUF1428 family)